MITGLQQKLINLAIVTEILNVTKKEKGYQNKSLTVYLLGLILKKKILTFL